MDGFWGQMEIHLHDTSTFTHPSFTGRDHELAQLADWLVFEEHPTVKVVTITGMAGIGKTQLVYNYFVQHAFHYRAIVWLDASSEEAFLTDVRSTLKHIGLPQPDSSACVDQLYIWLQSSDAWPWLLVLDNYSGGSSLIEGLLANRAGHAIITTRRPRLGAWETLHVQDLPQEESILLLLRRACLLASDTALSTVPADLMTQASAIVQAIGGLPLALDQIGAYIAEAQCMDDCLALLQREPMTLFARRGVLANTGESHPDALNSTYEQIFDELSPLSLEILRMLAFLPEAVSAAVLQQWLPAVGDSLATDFAVAELLKCSLVEVRFAPERTFRTHTVVRLLARASLSTEQQQTIARQAERLNGTKGS